MTEESECSCLVWSLDGALPQSVRFWSIHWQSADSPSERERPGSVRQNLVSVRDPSFPSEAVRDRRGSEVRGQRETRIRPVRSHSARQMSYLISTAHSPPRHHSSITPSLQPHPTTACMSYRFVVNKTQRSQLPGLESHQCLKSCQSLQRCRFCFFLNSKYKRSDFTDSIRRKDWLTQVQGHKHRVINLDPVGKTWHCKAGSRLFLYDYQLCDCC